MSGVVRAPGAHHVLVNLPRGDAAIARVLGPALSRLDPASPGPQLLVVTPDADTALAFARVARTDLDGARVLPATGAHRAKLLLGSTKPLAVAGPPEVLLALMSQAALKLEHVRTLVLAWVDDVVVAGGSDTLENLLAEVPKEISRTLVASRSTPETDALIERYLRRPAREDADAAGAEAAPAAVPISYITVSSAGRTGMLRRLLDELSPEAGVIAARSPARAREVRELLALLGYEDGGPIRVVRTEKIEASPVVILCELPDSAGDLAALPAPATRVFALVEPSDVPRLRELSSGAVTPLALEGPLARAHAADALLRGELRATLQAGVPPRLALSVAPLLDEFDGIDIAAAALHLLERARTNAPAAPAAAEGAAPGQWARIFMTVGTRDRVKANDIVGAVIGESGITKEQIGKVEVAESHALIEISAPLAEEVAKKMTGATIRGRRLIARLERDRPRRAPGVEPRRGPRRPTERTERPERTERTERKR